MAGRRVLFAGLVLAVMALSVSTAGAQPGQVICSGQVATIVGTPGDDTIFGTAGPDVISGLQGNDIIDGLEGDDIICGGFGDDLIVGSDGFDILFGAQGDDAIYSGGQSGYFIPDVYEDIRGARMFGGAGDDLIVGTDRWDRMQGGAGNDVLLGLAGNDWMRGGSGGDILIGHGGRDDMNGGPGPDRVLAERRDSNVRGGAGLDVCPDYNNTSSWRGCEQRIAVDDTDPTKPAFGIPLGLRTDGAYFVYIRIDAVTGDEYVGAAVDLDAVLEGSDDSLFEVNYEAVSAGQAGAILTAVAQDDPSLLLDLPAIDPQQPFYDDALEWGLAWLDVNFR